jgi:hypothetical protein
MSDELNAIKKSLEELLIDMMAESVMFTGVQDSLMRGVQASLSTAHGSRPSQPTIEKRTNQRDDLANTKLIPTILPDYIPPLDDAVSRESVHRVFDYTMVTVYLSKGICAFIMQ